MTQELSECIPSTMGVEEEYENGRLSAELDRFLSGLEPEKRVLFIRRYFYSQSVSQIAYGLQMSESKVKVTLHRVRESLRKFLEERDLL